MAFTKTSVGITTPVSVDEPFARTGEQDPRIGDERDGMVWNGNEWVTQAEWEAERTPVSKLPGDPR